MTGVFGIATQKNKFDGSLSPIFKELCIIPQEQFYAMRALLKLYRGLILIFSKQTAQKGPKALPYLKWLINSPGKNVYSLTLFNMP